MIVFISRVTVTVKTLYPYMVVVPCFAVQTHLEWSLRTVLMRSKTQKRLKRTLFNWTKHDKMCKFSRKSSI